MTFALCLAAHLATVGLAPPADWSQFRGPALDGVSPDTGLLKSWHEGGPPKVWSVTGLGGGYSSVSVSGGLIYGTGQMPDGKQHVFALKESDGSPVWSTPFAGKVNVGYGEGPRGTPTIADGRVYAVGMGGELACLDAATGKEVWSKNFVKDFGGNVPGWGYTESVFVADGRVYATPCSKKAAMVALDAKTGDTVWTATVDSPGGAGGYASMVPAEVGGVKMLINLLGKSGGVAAFRADTGKLLWQYAGVMNGTANIPSVLVSGDLIFCSTGYGDGGAALLKMTASNDGVTVKELKKYKAGELQNHHGGMVAIKGTIYLGHAHSQGFPAAVDFATGKILWKQQKGALGGQGSAALVAADGRLIFRYQNGVVALVEANPGEFVAVSSFKIPDPSGKPSWAHPAISGGKLYLRDQDRLHCYDLRATRAGVDR
jgi:outer membrane protein assembly factor BamB